MSHHFVSWTHRKLPTVLEPRKSFFLGRESSWSFCHPISNSTPLSWSSLLDSVKYSVTGNTWPTWYHIRDTKAKIIHSVQRPWNIYNKLLGEYNMYFWGFFFGIKPHAIGTKRWKKFQLGYWEWYWRMNCFQVSGNKQQMILGKGNRITKIIEAWICLTGL